MTVRAPAPGVPGRALAARAVDQVLGRGVTLEEAFGALQVEQVSGPDRAQARALAFGALRWHHRHRELLSLLLDRPLPARETMLEALLSVASFELLDQRQPEYAVVSAAVETARSLGRARAAGLVNATLRRLQREREALLAQVLARDAGRYSHPAWLIRRLQRDWPGRWREVLEANQQPPPLWLRVNPLRIPPADYPARLAAAGMAGAALAGVPEAVKLSQPVAVTAIPGFAEGEASVQDAAAQLAAGLLDAAPGMRVLDACAAPGGKTTHLLERAGNRLELLALDIDPARLDRVRGNLDRLGLAARVLAGDAARPADWWDGQPFDRILLDAPCSGTGVIRRHPDIKWLRRESDIEPLAARQLALLEATWPLLRPGGRLLYATCSVLRAENDAVVARFLAGTPDAALLPAGLPAWVTPVDAGGWQVLPGAGDTDGFYYALMARQRP